MHFAPKLEVHYRLVGMPDKATIAIGSTIHYELIAVEPLEDGAVELVMRYVDHD